MENSIMYQTAFKVVKEILFEVRESNNQRIYEVYNKNKPFIKALARRYLKLDPAISFEDLLSEGYIAVANALRTYDTSSDLNFSSYLWWHLQKRFQAVVGTDKIAEIKYSDGEEEVLPYREFLRVKRFLPKGTTWKISSLLQSFEELSGGEGGLR